MTFSEYLKKTNFTKILFIISILSFFLRLYISLHMISLTTSILLPPSTLDSGVYLTLSNDILSGSYKGAYYFQPFYYAVFLPIVRFFFQNSLWFVILIQCLLGGISVYLTGIIFSKLFDWKCGLAGALLLMFSRSVIILTPFLLIATLQTFWVILLFYLILLSYEKKSLIYWSLTGIVFACSILTRGNSLLLLPIPLIVIYFSYDKKIKAALPAFIIFCICTYIPQLPFSLHNYQITKQWVGPSTARDQVLAFGNTPDAAPGGVIYTDCYSYWQKQSSSKDKKVSVPTNILEWIRHSPGAYMELKWRSFLLYWSSYIIPNNVNYDQLTQNSTILSLPIFLSFNILGTLGLWGICLVLIRKSGIMVWIALSFVFIYSASIIIFYILERFRVPLYPLLCGFGGFAIISFTRYICEMKKKGIVLGIMSLVLSASFVNAAYPLYQNYFEKYALGIFRPYGTSYSLEKSFVVCDNGPVFLGGWYPYVVKNRIVIMKRFILNNNLSSGTEGKYFLQLPVYTTTEVEFDVRASVCQPIEKVQKTKINLDEKGFCNISIPVNTALEEVEGYVDIFIEIMPIKGRFSICLDSQRDYGRTKMFSDNTVVSLSELVCKLNKKR